MGAGGATGCFRVVIHFLAPGKEIALLLEISFSESQPLVRHIALVHVVPACSMRELRPEPMRLEPVLKPRLQHTVARYFAHVGGAVVPHRAGNPVLFDKRLCGVVELQRVVGGQGEVETAAKEGIEGVIVVMDKQGVVAHGRHGNSDLRKVPV